MSSDNSVLVCTHINEKEIYVLFRFYKTVDEKIIHLLIFFYLCQNVTHLFILWEWNIMYTTTSRVQLSIFSSSAYVGLWNLSSKQLPSSAIHSAHFVDYSLFCVAYLQYECDCQILQALFLRSLSQCHQLIFPFLFTSILFVPLSLDTTKRKNVSIYIFNKNVANVSHLLYSQTLLLFIDVIINHR